MKKGHCFFIILICLYCIFQYKRASGKQIKHLILIIATSFKGPVRINVTRDEEGMTTIVRHQRLSNKIKARSQVKGKVE